MRVAILDLGTNTFNLLVADRVGEEFKVIETAREIVRLGEGGINNFLIEKTPFQRGLQALLVLSEVVKKHHVSTIRAFATSAIRDAKNGRLFIEQCYSLTGITIEIITGDKEAELIYAGCRMAVEMDGDLELLMDIGGGSVEFIIANSNEIRWRKSFRVGLARLIDRFCPVDPISEKSVESIFSYLREELSEMVALCKSHKLKKMIGSSGAFESVASMVILKETKEGNSDFGKLSYRVAIPDYVQVSSMIRSSTSLEREQIKGLVPMRRDMIVMSMLLIDFVIDSVGIEELRVSSFSLKEGALFEL